MNFCCICSLESLNKLFFGASTSGKAPAFEKIKFANKSQIKLRDDFPKLWSFVGENNTIKN